MRNRRVLRTIGAGILGLVVVSNAGPVRAIVGDLAPGTASGSRFCPEADGERTIFDALVVLRRGVNLITEFACGATRLSDLIADVAPPESIDTTTSPPTVLPGGDGVVNAADALLVLRAASGLIQFALINASSGSSAFGTSPSPPFLGDLDRFPGPFWPEEFEGDIDCDGDEIYEPDPSPTRLTVLAQMEEPAPVPFEVCVWMKRDMKDYDFDAPPFDSPATPFPGPEDHDANSDRRLRDPAPPPDGCATVCPQGFFDPAIECAQRLFDSGVAFQVRAGPVTPGPPLGNQTWSAVVDPFHRLDDDNFSDNILLNSAVVNIAQCPPNAPDLEPLPPRLFPANADVDDDLTVEVRVVNEGSLPVRDSFWVDVWFDYAALGRGSTPEPGITGPFPQGNACREVVLRDGATLEPGESEVLQFDAFIQNPLSAEPPCDLGTESIDLLPGLHQITVLADSLGGAGFPFASAGAILEEDESNNVMPGLDSPSAGLFCLGSGNGFGRPDMAITAVRFFQRGTDARACTRLAGDSVDVEVQFENLDTPSARDLALSGSGTGGSRLYELQVPKTSLDGLLFDCVPVGVDLGARRAGFQDALTDTNLRVGVRPGSQEVPQDVDNSNNFVTVPLLNKPPSVNAGNDTSGTVDVDVRLTASASDPNNVPAGSQPLSFRWSVVSKPQGSQIRFGSQNGRSTTFRGDTEGDYTLRVRAEDCPGDDDTLSDSDTVTVSLSAP